MVPSPSSFIYCATSYAYEYTINFTINTNLLKERYVTLMK